jgi:hypothetical protein
MPSRPLLTVMALVTLATLPAVAQPPPDGFFEKDILN